ncbi:MAG TPA: GDSL family lipase, partial [Terriglobia bacterium]|nr:GDSL family lipase [Terriglobia bacterium]
GDTKLAQQIVPDRVHPGPGGHLVMAGALLEAWDAPATVSAVEIDAATKRVVHADHAAITEVTGSGGLAWTEADEALPMPIDLSDAVVALAVRSSNFVAALDQQPLKVTGLSAPRYKLKIDGDVVGEFTREQLEAGINLAIEPTPMLKQALAVHKLTVEHNNVHFARWRNVQVPLETDSAAHKQPAMEALDQLESDLVREQRAAAQPKPRGFELTPQSP